MSVKVAINGFGRIGRLAFRQMFGAEGFEVVAINDLTSPAMLAHLLKYDSTQGAYAAPFGTHTVEAGEDNIVVDGKKITIYAKANAAELPWGELGVDVVDDGGQVVASGSRDDDLLGAGVDVSLSLGLGSVETGALQDDVNIQLTPGQLGSVSLSVDGDFLAVDNDVVLASLDSVSAEGSGVSTLSGVVLQQVSQHLGGGQVVDSDNLEALSAEHLTESQTADTAKTIDSNFNRHGSFLQFLLLRNGSIIYFFVQIQ